MAQAHSSAAIVNFSENCDKDLMGPYLDTLITKLLLLLQRGKRLVQEGALTAMASVADCAQDHFTKYYDAVVPLLSAILVNATDKTHRLLRAKALECISLVGLAVGRDRFRHDAASIMGIMQQLQAAAMDPDDPTGSYMLQAGARLCKCLGQEFLPYLPAVMPPLLASAQLEPDIRIRGEDDDEEDDDEDDGDMDHIEIGDKILSIRTSTLEEKATACSMLCLYANELKDGFFGYVKPVSDIMVPLVKFVFHEDVRRAAAQTLPELIHSAVLAVQKGTAPPGTDPSCVKVLLDAAWPALLNGVDKEREVDVLVTQLESLGEVIDFAPAELMDEAKVSGLFDAVIKVLDASDKRRAALAQRTAAEDFDDEEREALEAEAEGEEMLFDQVGTLLGAALKKFGDAVLPFVERLFPKLSPYMAASARPTDRRIVICVVDDILEHSPAGRAKYAGSLLPTLLDAVTAADEPELVQCAAYGLGILAAKAPVVFRPMVEEAAKRIVVLLQRPDARDESNDMATDNVVSTLCKMLAFHADVLSGPHGAVLGDLLVSFLPLKADRTEAVWVHEQLVAFMEAGDVRVLGDGNKNLPQLVGAMVQVLGHGQDLIDGAAGQRMAALLTRLQGSVGADVANGAMAKLDAKQKAHLGMYMAGQVPPRSSSD